MSYRDTLLTKEQAAVVIKNFEFTLEEACGRLSKTGREDVGILYSYRGLFDRIDGLVEEYGVQIVGTVLETKRSGLNVTDPALYYEPSNSATGQMWDDYQSDWVSSLLYDLYEMANELQDDIEREISEEDEGETREASKPTKQELEEEYKRARKRLQSLLRRRKKAGIDVWEIKIPKIPKKITQGSINRLIKLALKTKTQFRYLSGGRYRGMK